MSTLRHAFTPSMAAEPVSPLVAPTIMMELAESCAQKCAPGPFEEGWDLLQRENSEPYFRFEVDCVKGLPRAGLLAGPIGSGSCSRCCGTVFCAALRASPATAPAPSSLSGRVGTVLAAPGEPAKLSETAVAHVTLCLDDRGPARPSREGRLNEDSASALGARSGAELRLGRAAANRPRQGGLLLHG